MVQFYNGKKVEDYVTLVDNEETDGVDNTATIEVNLHEKVIGKTQYSYKEYVLRGRKIVFILVLGLSAAVIGLIYRSSVQENEMKLLKKLVPTDAIQEQWLNGSSECDFEISDTRMIQQGHYDSHVVGGQRGTGCVDVCSHMKAMDPLINGVTVFVNTTKEGCWCHRNMTAISPRYKSCFLEFNYTEITKDIDDAAYTCDLQPGTGYGGINVYVGNLIGNACINACLYLKQVDNMVNGVSIYPKLRYRRGGCFCRKGMRTVHRSPWYTNSFTCRLMPRHNTSVTVDNKLCDFSIGNAYGATKIYMGNLNEHDCIQDCSHMRRIDSSINGVTINPKNGYCWCVKRMINITTTYKTCFLNSTGNTTACHFSNGHSDSIRPIQIPYEKGSACVDACLRMKLTYPSINGVTVYSDSTKRGCFCNSNMTSIAGTRKTCFLKSNITHAPAYFNGSRPKCEFKIGDGDGVSEVYLGKYKGETCINACLHLKRIDNLVNGVTILVNSNVGGCWCERGMKSQLKPYRLFPRYKSCILEYNDAQTERCESQATSICKLSNGYGVGRSGAEINLRKQSKFECIEGCSQLKRADPSINGITYDITTKECSCQRHMERIGKYKSCFLKS